MDALTPEDRAQFAALRMLQPNWDTYGSPTIFDDCIREAETMLSSLRKAGWGGPWSIVPCSGGGVQIEQHCYGKDIEIAISRSTHTVQS